MTKDLGFYATPEERKKKFRYAWCCLVKVTKCYYIYILAWNRDKKRWFGYPTDINFN